MQLRPLEVPHVDFPARFDGIPILALDFSTVLFRKEIHVIFPHWGDGVEDNAPEPFVVFSGELDEIPHLLWPTDVETYIPLRCVQELRYSLLVSPTRRNYWFWKTR